MSCSDTWTWKAETPASVPWGARISAGNSGSVARSLPNRALALVNRSPVSCMPSPESPAKRTTMRSSGSVTGREAVSVTTIPLDCRVGAPSNVALRARDRGGHHRSAPSSIVIGIPPPTSTNETMNDLQRAKVRDDDGFIAALDQSGGSTPKALSLYGVEPDAYDGEAEMFDRIHEMRSRIITSPSFGGDRILGRDPVRDDHGSLHRGRPDRRLPVGTQAGRAVPQGRQGPRRRSRRRAADEAHRWSRAPCVRVRSTTACSAPRCARWSSTPTRPASPPSSISSSRSGPRSSLPGSCRSSSPRSTSTARPRARPRRCCASPSLAHLDDLPDDQVIMLKLTLPDVDGFYDELVAHPTGPASRGPVGRLQPRRCQRSPGAQPRRHRQLQSCAHRGSQRPTEPRGVRLRPSTRPSRRSSRRRAPDAARAAASVAQARTPSDRVVQRCDHGVGDLGDRAPAGGAGAPGRHHFGATQCRAPAR